jgi:hypothetical protein
MIEQTVILPVSTPVEVELTSDSKGIVSLGIRINGSNWCILASGVTLPKPGSSSPPWSKTIGDIMK